MRLFLSIFFLLTIAYAQRLAPGDKIRLICEQEPTLSVERVLSPAGEIALPLLGVVNLAGKYIAEAEDQLQRLAAARLRTDRILVAITLVFDDSAPIAFGGAVNRNGSVPYHTGLTLNDIVKLASPTAAAATEAVEITQADGKKIVVDLSKGGGATRLRPGDRVNFPRAEESNEVLVLGGVVRPGSKPYKSGMTLRSLVELAGGVTGHGQADKVRLDRKGQAVKTIDLDTSDADIDLKRGDIVTVPQLENGRYVTITGFVSHPGLVEYHEGMTLTGAIKAAGGLSMLAGADSVTVKRLGAWKRRFDYTKISANQEKDLVLVPADIVDVPLVRPRKSDEAPTKNKPRTGPVVPPR